MKSRAEQLARMVVCRANDVDPFVPDESIEELFNSYDGERAVLEARKGLLTFAHELLEKELTDLIVALHLVAKQGNVRHVIDYIEIYKNQIGDCQHDEECLIGKDI